MQSTVRNQEFLYLLRVSLRTALVKYNFFTFFEIHIIIDKIYRCVTLGVLFNKLEEAVMSLECEKSIFDLLKALYFKELSNIWQWLGRYYCISLEKIQCISGVHGFVFLLYKLNSNVTSSMTLSEASPLANPYSKIQQKKLHKMLMFRSEFLNTKSYEQTKHDFCNLIVVKTEHKA